MSSTLSSTTSAKLSFCDSRIEFDHFARFRQITSAFHSPNSFRQSILPSLPEGDILLMEPLDWEFGVRVDRPFEFRLRRTRHARLPRIPPRPSPSNQQRQFRGGAVRIEEYPNFAEMAPPASDPYATPPATIKPGVLKIWFGYLLLLLHPLWDIVMASCLALAGLVRVAMPYIVSGGKAVAERAEWRAVVSLLLAAQIVRLLPGLERVESVESVVETVERSGVLAPLYIIMIPMTAAQAAA